MVYRHNVIPLGWEERQNHAICCFVGGIWRIILSEVGQREMDRHTILSPIQDIRKPSRGITGAQRRQKQREHYPLLMKDPTHVMLQLILEKKKNAKSKAHIYMFIFTT